MTLTLKPRGRGNWATTVMSLSGERVGALSVAVGQLLVLGGITWRICEVRP